MPIRIRKESSGAPDDAMNPAWLRWLPLCAAVLAGILLIPGVFNGWVIAGMIAYVLLLAGLSCGYRSAAARVFARLLLMIVPLAWLVIVGLEAVQLLSNPDLTGEVGYAGQIAQYCLFFLCQMVLPFLLPVMAGAGFCAAHGRRFDNVLLRITSVLAAVLLIVACACFGTGVSVPLLGRVLVMPFAVELELFQILVCVITAAVAVLSFVVFSPFGRKNTEKEKDVCN